jgi:uncharacterized protein
MLKVIATASVCLIAITGLSEPEIKGTASELAQFLGDMPRTVAIAGEAQVRTPAQRAVLILKVVTENKSLQEAMRVNADVRRKVADQLRKRGITNERIQASKFSSTPQYGIFTDKVRSYRIEHALRIAVQDERELQNASGAIDLFPEVQFAGVEYDYADKEAVKTQAALQAFDHAERRRALYEEKFGLELVPVAFHSGELLRDDSGVPPHYNPSVAARPYSPGLSRSAPGAAAQDVHESVSSFGELVCTAKVTVEYHVKRRSGTTASAGP